MKIDNNDLLQLYIDMLPFMHSVLGDNTEIVIHDLTDESSSIIAIENPLSHRKVGYPITDLASELVHKGKKEDLDYIANYKGTAKGMEFRSYTYFIKNEGHIIGLLCINKSTQASTAALDALINLLESNNLSDSKDNSYHETLDSSVSEFVSDKISATIARSGISVDDMSIKAKQDIVLALEEEGVLNQKGAVTEVAEKLNISVPTLYRYLKNATRKTT